MIASVISRLSLSLARLESWLETMRAPTGYAGPVAHWWRDSLFYCGAGLDWRYEGIICGYVSLFERTGDSRWLQKARRAGDDLIAGQSADGCYRDSQFELNPGTGGTPHEAAADLGLLTLARALLNRGDDAGQIYQHAAETNLRRFHLGRLWSDTERRFRDDPRRPTFVPNKSATIIEALCQLAAMSGQDELLQRYVRPTADAILALQRRAPRLLAGAIAQNAIDGQMIEKYFPYYNARCVPGLISAYETLGDDKYLDAALNVMSFLLRCRDDDGGFPQVIYEGGRVNRYPRWIAGLGDVLRAADIAGRYQFDFPLEPTLEWILGGQLPSGAIATARGFGSQITQMLPGALPDARDLIPVVGWNDKTFRYLAAHASIGEEPDRAHGGRVPCRWHRRAAVLNETESALWISDSIDSRNVFYRWTKGHRWAEPPGRG